MKPKVKISRPSLMERIRQTLRERSGRTFFVDQLSDKELALFHDPERP